MIIAMFGNHLLPNIALSPLLLLLPPPHIFPHCRLHCSPREHLHGLSEGMLIAEADAHLELHHVTITYHCHITTFWWSPCLLHCYYCPSPHQGIWANDICHIIHCQWQLPMPCHPKKVPTIKCHVMKTEGAKSAEKGVGGGRKRGKERERGNCGWGGGHLCPLPPAAMFQRPARQCASHTPSHLSFFIP